MSQVTYTDLVKSVATAVNTALGSVNKWNIAGRDVSAFYPNQEA